MGLFTDDKKKDEKQPVAAAIKPNAFFSIPAFIRNEAADKNGNTDEERILASGAQTQFWITLRGYIEEVISELDAMNSQAIAQGLSFDEIGKNTVVIDLTKGIVKRIFGKVTDAKDAIEEAAKEEAEKNG